MGLIEIFGCGHIEPRSGPIRTVVNGRPKTAPFNILFVGKREVIKLKEASAQRGVRKWQLTFTQSTETSGIFIIENFQEIPKRYFFCRKIA